MTDEQPDHENSDPCYDPLDNRGMCVVYIAYMLCIVLFVIFDILYWHW